MRRPVFAAMLIVLAVAIALVTTENDVRDDPPGSVRRASTRHGRDDKGKTQSTATHGPSTSSPSTSSPSTSADQVPQVTPAKPTSAKPTCPLPDGLREQVSELVMVSVDPARPQAAVELLRGHPHLGGVFIGGNDTTILTSGLFKQVAEAGGFLVAADEEGGRVQRLDALAGPMPSPRVQTASMSPDQIEHMAAGRGRRLRASGINVDFAPVVDVTVQPDRGVIGDRSYGSTPEVVIKNAGAFARGLRSAGVLPTLKHFPGHGSSSGDSHRSAVGVPAVAQLWRSDLVPFAVLSKQQPVAVMVGHLDVPGLTEAGLPASLSAPAYRLLRQEVGFQGLVFTDDLSGMRAVTSRFDTATAVEKALQAGADIALLGTAEVDPYLDHLMQAVQDGRLAPATILESARRVIDLKQELGLVHC